MNQAMKEEDGRPVYDKRVKEILDQLAQNVSREAIAQQLGHKNYKSLDMHMRRRNFTWDSRAQTYVPKLHDKQTVPARVMPQTKSGIVIEMMKDQSVDLGDVLAKVGFNDSRQLADYMRGRGYLWSASERNYRKERGAIQNEKLPIIIEPLNQPEAGAVDQEKGSGESLNERLIRLLPLLEELEANRERLQELLHPADQKDTLPRYVIPGRTSGKTIQMADALQNLAVEYCNERNIKQRELFEVALIEFLKHSGYQQEVTNLLESY